MYNLADPRICAILKIIVTFRVQSYAKNNGGYTVKLALPPKGGHECAAQHV